MIAKNQMMEVLLEVCPSFQPAWGSFLTEWKESADDLPLYIALAKLADHLIGMLERAETATFPTVFQAVERLQLEGDYYVREAIVIGLLEDLQNLNLHENGTEPEQFRSFFGPESAGAWDELYRVWHEFDVRKAAGLIPPGPASQIDLDSIQSPELRHVIRHYYRKG